MGEDEPASYYGIQYLPDNILLYVFSYLPATDLANASCMCHKWFQVSLDDLLWKELFYRKWRIDASIPMAPGKSSWREEYKRLHYNTPVLESEVIHKHKDQVLHVSFSHNGKMFATCSKDGTVKVWLATYPATLKFQHDMKEFSWKYTQFSNFNESDTLLLVSGVHFGNMSTSGEIMVFSLVDNFELQCRVINKPYDVFGSWYDNEHLLSGSLNWTGQLNSCSSLWLNKASQLIESERESVVMKLFRFNNTNASSIRTIMISNIYGEVKKEVANGDRKLDNLASGDRSTTTLKSAHCVGDTLNGTIKYKSDYRKAELEKKKDVCETVSSLENLDDLKCPCCDDDSVKTDDNVTSQPNISNNGLPSKVSFKPSPSNNTHVSCDKLLIFTMGSLTYTPHQIGIKRIKAEEAAQSNVLGVNIVGGRVPFRLPEVTDNNQGGVDRPYDNVDTIFDMDGHIIGMSLSPDHRYLYVNSRPWPQGSQIADPLMPPPIAQNIEMHVIDLFTMKEVGTMLRSHKAYTPNDECFFIFLDVCNEYVASGAEDKHGYIWDRHYGTFLHRFPHNDVVNCVAFNPVDPEVMVSVSDDNSIKVWRSRNKERLLKSKANSQSLKPKSD